MSEIQEEIVDTVLVSDIHFSTPLCQATALEAALRQFRFRRLILNGDINEDNHPRLKKSHLKVWAHLSGLSKPENDCEVVYIKGNHDRVVAATDGGHIGAKVYDEYRWEYKGKKCLALHGDLFDQFYQNNPLLSEFATSFYLWLQKYRWSHPLCRWMKRNTKHYNRAIELVAEGATAYAREEGVDHVFCGHTHHAEHRYLNGVHYWNDGSWTEVPCTLITIGPKGIRIHEFDATGTPIAIHENLC